MPDLPGACHSGHTTTPQDVDATIELWRRKLSTADGSGGLDDAIALAAMAYGTVPFLLDGLDAARVRVAELEAAVIDIDAPADPIPIGPDRDTGTRAVVEPRTVALAAELDALPFGAVILLERGVVAMATAAEEDAPAPTGWTGIGHGLTWSSAQVVKYYATRGIASFTVLYVPTGEADGD